MFRFGFIGAGRMAGVYADRIHDIHGTTVGAVASPNTADEFVDRYALDATAYQDPAAMCADATIDAVAVLTPTDTHPEFVALAADHGLDVMCEKPIARTVEGGNRIKAAVDRAGITCMVAHVLRFFPEYAAARDRVMAGEIGEPGIARARRHFGYTGERGWFDDRSRSGGVLLDLAVHDFDFLRWTLGEVDRVFTRRATWSREAESEVSLTLLRFETGAVGHVESWTIEVPSVPFNRAFEFAGDGGLIEYDLEDVRPLAVYDRDDVSVPRDALAGDRLVERDAYTRQIESFVDAASSGSEPTISVEDAIASMRVSLAAIESAKRGTPVCPAQVGP